MALWKPFRGNRVALKNVEKHDGYVYFCADDGSLFFDYIDTNGDLQRKQLNAKDAETLTGVSLADIHEYVNTKTQLENIGIYIGPDEPTDQNIKIWINTAEEGTGVVPMLPRIATITLAKNGWGGSSSPYYQTVNIPSVTTSTKIDLLPTAQQVVSLQEQDIALMAENDETGTVKIYSFGGKPYADMTMQVQLTEVAFV